ncbi:N-acetylglucosamine-6-phosphate deacetylase [uncultured Eubacterium sp.]|uniref:N-acetylglucosamine-6-phosphate deacetylase n=1 Tax=uncultured Eubacterium sp. TaxID=165185 RepID=UPI0025E583D2|nr:N-acetylglucosamine-6-phosphate deacetylase [uncultured Eubacterium sp.]
MYIKNGMVFLPEGRFEQKNLNCNERILAVKAADEEMGIDLAADEMIVDATGKYVIPGLVDIHSHGAVNADASDADVDGLRKMSRYYAQKGVTSWCPTTMTLSEEQLLKAMHAIRDFTSDGANCIGVHLEGPFVSYEKRGAQNAAYLQKPDIEELKKLNEACGGQVRMITVAPEEDKNDAFIREASKICTVSLGHSVADYEQAKAAFEAGATHVTHMFNGMNGLHHRNPGIIGAAFDAGATVELICDGFHIDPSVIRMTAALFGNKLNLISDSMRCAGMPEGEYSLGGQPVWMKAGKATLADGTLAGSSIHLMDAVRNVVRFGVPLEQAIRVATLTPAEAIGLESEIGCIQEGARADLLILNQDLELETVIIGGNIWN